MRGWLAVCLLVAAITSDADAATLDQPAIAFEAIATNLAKPVTIAHAGDGSGRLFIVLQEGQIVVHDGQGVLPRPFLDIRALVSCCGEQGLLGLAFHPGYTANGSFFVNYTDTTGATVVARYSVSAADPDRADPDSAVTVLTIQQPFSNHNGGQLKFGPDGYLYVGMGDGGSGGDPQNNAQNLGSLLGKMLRIDVDGAQPYAVPPDNPFVTKPGARPEIWALGLRNPWRFTFDRATGDLFIGDVGQDSWEEIDFQPASSSGGENYGWRLMEGTHCFNPAANCNSGTLTLPIAEYSHALGCSVTGGYRYRGQQIPELYGVYLYGDFCSGRVWGASQDGVGQWHTVELLDTAFLISTFGEDEAGELYLAHRPDNAPGAVYRIIRPGTQVVPVVAGLTPASAIAGDPGFTLLVAGVGFATSSVVRWNGGDRPTTFISGTQLSARISAADIAEAGTAAVSVFTPVPGGGLSGAVPFDINATFLDVSTSFWASGFIDVLAHGGITAGCGSRRFCPDQTVTRAQMAIFLVRAMDGPADTPPPATGTVFVDVPADAFAADWIEQLAATGITAGCGHGAYCPDRAITRGEMAVLLLRAQNGASYHPPPASGSEFSDVPASHPFAASIEQLAAEGITAGCGGNRYCPEDPVTRAQMAVFLVRAFSLPP
jgi:glucose/arabinose dehydrogenase